MKTLGFGIKSLLKDPQWAARHVGNYQQGNIIKPLENENDKFAPNKSQLVSGGQDSIFTRAAKGELDPSGVNSIFSQQKVDPSQGANNIFAQSKIGAANGNLNIFEMMNKFDEDHKPLMGAQGVQPSQNIDPMNSIPEDENLRKVGKKLNLLM